MLQGAYSILSSSLRSSFGTAVGVLTRVPPASSQPHTKLTCCSPGRHGSRGSLLCWPAIFHGRSRSRRAGRLARRLRGVGRPLRQPLQGSSRGQPPHRDHRLRAHRRRLQGPRGAAPPGVWPGAQGAGAGPAAAATPACGRPLPPPGPRPLHAHQLDRFQWPAPHPPHPPTCPPRRPPPWAPCAPSATPRTARRVRERGGVGCACGQQ